MNWNWISQTLCAYAGDCLLSLMAIDVRLKGFKFMLDIVSRSPIALCIKKLSSLKKSWRDWIVHWYGDTFNRLILATRTWFHNEFHLLSESINPYKRFNLLGTEQKAVLIFCYKYRQMSCLRVPLKRLCEVNQATHLKRQTIIVLLDIFEYNI